MNRRQRKKNSVGEFVRFGFEVEAELVPGTFADDAFWDSVIAYVESKSLLFGGGGPPGEIVGYVIAQRGKRLRSVTDVERVAFATWLLQHPQVKNAKTHPLSDANR